jgi:histidine ammonia-lyase
MVANLERILGIEALCAAQGVEFRAPLTTSPALQATIARLRATIPPLGEDRYLAPDLEAAASLVRDGALLEASGAALPELAP